MFFPVCLLQGEYHANNQAMAKLMHKAIGLGKGSEASDEAYAAYQVRSSLTHWTYT